MARRSEEAPVSFFSFQDVLMALIGIVVLITVMLLLVAITRAAGSVAEAVQRSSTDSAVEVAKLEQRRDALIEAISRASSKAGDKSGARRADVALDLRLSQSEVNELKDEIEAIQSNIRDLINRHPNAAAAGMLQAREDARAKLEAELERESQRRQVTYIVGGEVKEVPVGIELSADKGVVFLLGKTESALVVGYGSSLETIIDTARHLADGRAGGFYLLLVVKPSGVQWFDRLIQQYSAMPEGDRPKIGLDLVREGGHCVGLFPAGGKDAP